MINRIKNTMSRIMAYGGYVLSSAFNADPTLPAVQVEVSNIIVNGNNRSKVPVAYPYGFGAIPPPNLQILLINPGQNGQNPIIIGALDSPGAGFSYTPQPSESYNYNKNWLLTYQLGGIIAYKNNDTTSYQATLPSGEWMNKILTDIISRLGAIESFINNHEHTAGTYTAPSGGGPVAGVSGMVVSPITDDPDLGKKVRQKTLEDAHGSGALIFLIGYAF